MTIRTLAILGLLTLTYWSCGNQQGDKSTNFSSSIYDYIYERESPTVIISGDLAHLFESGTVDEETGKENYHQAQLSISDGSSHKDITAKIAKRGVTRKRICEFPPIKLKFNKDTLAQHQLSDFNTYKLVTHCIDSLEELVLKELLTYQMYNHLTDNSFRVKRLNVIYKDQVTGTQSAHSGFIIEEDEELAYRLNAALYEGDIKSLDRKQYAQMVIFQYMIGNTDWNLTNGHNMKWIQQRDLPSPTPIPYDFDFCGLVNAPHASPHPNMPIKSVRERMLQWRGKTKTELVEIAEKFITEKEQLYKLIENTEGLSTDSKEDMKGFLEEFYTDISSEEFFQ